MSNEQFSSLNAFCAAFMVVWQRVQDVIAAKHEGQPPPEFNWEEQVALLDRHLPRAAAELTSVSGEKLDDCERVLNEARAACGRARDGDAWSLSYLPELDAYMHNASERLLARLHAADMQLPELSAPNVATGRVTTATANAKVPGKVTVNERMAAMLLADPTRVDWTASAWAMRLSDDLKRSVSAAAVKQTDTWKKQIVGARALMGAKRAERGR